jgi:hypothetical protein
VSSKPIKFGDLYELTRSHPWQGAVWMLLGRPYKGAHHFQLMLLVPPPEDTLKKWWTSPTTDWANPGRITTATTRSLSTEDHWRRWRPSDD